MPGLSAWTLGLLLSASPLCQEEKSLPEVQDPVFEEPSWSLLEVPEVVFDGQSFATDPARLAQLRAQIDALVHVDRPAPGYSATISWTQFAPLPEVAENVHSLLLADHRTETSPALRELVHQGPWALPVLLEALDDRRPTSLVIGDGDWPLVLYRTSEAPIHRASPLERAVKARHPSLFTLWDPPAGSLDPEWLEDAEVERHTVTVGDLAFVALGQITNRAYHAARYQPSGLAVVNSPTSQPELAAFLRDLWRGRDRAADLFQSLLVDLYTRGEGSEGLQAGAVLRLLFYFPDQAGPIVAERLANLEVSGDEEPLGVGLLQAAALTNDPGVAPVLCEQALHAPTGSVFLACLSPEVVRVAPARLLERARKLRVDVWNEQDEERMETWIDRLERLGASR